MPRRSKFPGLWIGWKHVKNIIFVARNEESLPSGVWVPKREEGGEPLPLDGFQPTTRREI